MTLDPLRTLLVQDRIPANLPVLETVRGFDVLEVVGTVWTLEKTRLAMRLHAADLVIIDSLLAGVAASDVCHEIKTRLLVPKIILLVPSDDPAHRQAAALAGADALVSRESLAEALERALATLFPERFKRRGGEG